MISQDQRNLKLIYSILLFLVLSLFTVYPHIDILKYRSETVIDNNAKDRKYISSYQLNQNDYISTTININDKIKEMIFKIDTSKIKNNIKIELSQVNVKQIYEIGQSNDINKIIKLEKNKFKAGKLNIKIINTSENSISYIVNYPNKTSGYIKLNGSKDVNAFSIYLKTIYSGSDFLLVSWIVFILILFIQGYISYIVFAKELQDNRVYWLSALLFLLVCILRFPLLTLWAEPISETMTLYVKYNLDKSFSILDMLLVTDLSMTYLSSAINIIGRILGLDKYLIVYLYLSGIIIACLWLALFTRISLRKYFPDYIRLIIAFSLLNQWDGEAFYINSMFIYWGIYFIIFMYLIDLDKLSKLQYILGMILIFLIVNNKMSYIFLVPSAFLMIFYYGLKNKRKLYMQIVIIISCFMNYIVYSLLTSAQSSRSAGMIERIFDIDNGIIKMLDGIASVINLQVLFPKYTQIFSLFILLILIIYSIYIIIKNKNIKNNGYIIFVILVAVFMSQYTHIIGGVGTYQEQYLIFKKLEHGRRFYMLYLSTYFLIISLIYITHKYKMNNKLLSILLILLVTIPWQFQLPSMSHIGKNNVRLDSYNSIEQFKYIEYSQYIHNDKVFIPSALRVWAYSSIGVYGNNFNYNNYYSVSKGSSIFGYDPNDYGITKEYNNFNNFFITNKFKSKCIVSLFNHSVDQLYNYGKVRIDLYSKGDKITSYNNINDNKYGNLGFIFKEPICNIDRIELTDEENKSVWVTGRIILGVVK